MSLNRQEKAIVIEEIAAKIGDAQSIVVAEYRGLDVASVYLLRKSARDAGVYLKVLKNSLARRVIADSRFKSLSDKLVGPLIYCISSDPVSAAKVLAGFAKNNDKLIIKAGALSSSLLDYDDIMELAIIPSREELIARLMATMQAPVAKFVRTINEVPTSFVRVLSAIHDQKKLSS